MAYRIIDDINDWQDARILLIDIQADETAYIRDLSKRTIPDNPLPVLEAIAKASRQVAETPWQDGFVFFLHPSVKWRDEWGKIDG